MTPTASERPMKAEQYNKYGCLKLSLILGGLILAMMLLTGVAILFTTGDAEAFGMLLPIALVIAAGMALMAAAIAYMLGAKERAFKAGCAQAQGVVVDKQIAAWEGVTSGAETRREHHIFYTFPEGKGQDGTALRYRQTVELADYDRLTQGTVVTVLYRPDNPRRSRLADFKDPVTL